MTATAMEKIPQGIPVTWKGKALTHFWPYRSPDGTVLGYVTRYDRIGEKKDVVPFFEPR